MGVWFRPDMGTVRHVIAALEAVSALGGTPVGWEGLPKAPAARPVLCHPTKGFRGAGTTDRGANRRRRRPA